MHSLSVRPKFCGQLPEPDRANQPFSVGVLPWRSRCRWSVANALRAKPPYECFAIGAIAIANNIVRAGLPAASLRQLSGDPCRRTRISASSRALERNKLVRAVHSSMRTSTIGHEHRPIRPARQPHRVCDIHTELFLGHWPRYQRLSVAHRHRRRRSQFALYSAARAPSSIIR